MRLDSLTVGVLVSAVLCAQPSMPGEAGARPALAMLRVGPVALPFPGFAGPILLVREDMVDGVLFNQGYAVAFVQLAVRRPGGRWAVTPGGVAVARPRVRDRPVPWSLPIRTTGCGESPLDVLEITALLSRNRLPPGPIEDTPLWNRVVARSESALVSCASFARTRLAVERVGQRLVKPHDNLPVAQFEDVAVRVEDAPPGSLVQLCVTPIDNAARRWCAPGVYPPTGVEWIGTAYFGRPDIVRIGDQLTYRDLYTRFRLQAYIVRRPLPVREADGIGAAEWLALQRLIAAQSEPVEVVRAFGPAQVRIRIRSLGETSDGRNWLVRERTRVEGLFEPMPAYRPAKKEIITLLVRGADDRAWRAAGWTALSGNRTAWVMPLADLNPANDPSGGERIAIATVSLKRFDESKPITSDVLNATAISVSDERVFWLREPGR